MQVPSDLRYTTNHEWVRITGSLVVMGITDYAQDALGDIVYIQLPESGSVVELHQSFSEIESTKSVNDVYAPVAGIVTQSNVALSATPELLNSDPYGNGWICEIESSGSDTSALLSPEQYRELIGV